jgi:hypothetical protein
MKKAWKKFCINCWQEPQDTHCSSELSSTRGTVPVLNLSAIFIGIIVSLKNLITAPGSDLKICSGREARGVCGWIGCRQRSLYKSTLLRHHGHFCITCLSQVDFQSLVSHLLGPMPGGGGNRKKAIFGLRDSRMMWRFVMPMEPLLVYHLGE